MSRILFCAFCSDEDIGASRKPMSPFPGERVQSWWGATVGQGAGGALGLHRLLSSGVVVTWKTPSFQPGDKAGQVGQRLPAVSGQASAGGRCPPTQTAGGRKKRDVAWGHSSRVQLHFAEQGGGETPWNVVSIRSALPPATRPLGSHRVRLWPI